MMYLVMVECIDPSIPAHNLEQRLRLTQNYVDLAPVTNRIHLARRCSIISPMPTGQTPVALSRVTRRNSILAWMTSQGVLLLDIQSSQWASSYRRCSYYVYNLVNKYLRTFAYTPPGPPAPHRRRATTSASEPEISRGTAYGTSL